MFRVRIRQQDGVRQVPAQTVGVGTGIISSWTPFTTGVGWELAGHSELTMTQRYMHLSPAALDSAIQLLDERGDIVATATTRDAKCNG